MGDKTQERKEGQQVHKMGQGLCTTPMPQPLTQPSHALPKNAICTTKLTGCDEGTIPQEGNTWRGDITQERKKCQQVHKMGQVCAPHPWNKTPHTTLACIAGKIHLPTQTHGLRRRNHNTGGKHVAGRHNPREKGRSASAQDGVGVCTTPMPQPLTQPSHALPENAICPTKLTGCDEGTITREGNTWRGDITQERKECQQVHKMGQVCAPHQCHNPSHNRRMHCRKKPFAQPNSRAATKEP